MLSRKNRGKLLRQLRDYGIITIAMLLGVIGVNLFLLPNEITTGGLMGIASIVYWGTGIPMQNTFFVLNAVLCHLLCCRPPCQLATPKCAVLHHLRQISRDW